MKKNSLNFFLLFLFFLPVALLVCSIIVQQHILYKLSDTSLATLVFHYFISSSIIPFLSSFDYLLIRFTSKYKKTVLTPDFYCSVYFRKSLWSSGLKRNYDFCWRTDFGTFRTSSSRWRLIEIRESWH